MQFELVFLLLFAFCYSAPHEGLPLLNPGGIGGIFKGPNSETIIQGPDGSEITSEEKSGVVIRDHALDEQPIVVAEAEAAAPAPAPIISSTSAPYLATYEDYSASPAPAIASAAPILASPSPAPLLTGETYEDYGRLEYAAPEQPAQPLAYAPALEPVPEPAAPIEAKPIEIVEQDPHIIETEIVEAPDVEPEQNSDLKGPSGRIITKGSASIVSGPASTTITEPRKIIIAPAKINLPTPVAATLTIPLKEVPALPVVTASTPAPLPAVIASTPAPYAAALSSTPAPLSAVSFDGSSTIAPPALAYSTTAAPANLGYSSTAEPQLGLLSNVQYDTSRINLGPGSRDSIPVIEYSSSNGIISSPRLSAFRTAYSTTEAPLVSSTIAAVSTDRLVPTGSPAVPAGYLVPPAAPSSPVPQAEGLVYSTASPNIQKIPRLDESFSVDGRVDMGYPKPTSKYYQLPQVLGEALTTFYQRTPQKGKDTVIIDDKMGELSQNEIATYDTRPSYQPQPNEGNAKYIAPALTRSGLIPSDVNFEPVPYAQIGPYQGAYLSNRYERNADKRRS